MPIEAREQQPARSAQCGAARECIEDAVGAADVDAAIDNRGRAVEGAACRPRRELRAHYLFVDPQVIARADEHHAVGDAWTADYKAGTGLLPHRAAGGPIDGERRARRAASASDRV